MKTKTRKCLDCGDSFEDIVTECRGEYDGGWCNGDHNCYFCKLKFDFSMLLAGRKGGYSDRQFGPDQALVDWFDSLPEDHGFKVQVTTEFERALS